MGVGASTEDVARMRKFAEHYAGKTGTTFHPDPEVTELVLLGLARNRTELGRPLFVRPDGQPITEHLPEGHEGRAAWGLVKDPTPDSGREAER
jgi:ferredoxin-thioredoxin reductase catalytic chain